MTLLARRRAAAAAAARWQLERSRWLRTTAALRARIADHRATIVAASGFVSGCAVGLVRRRGFARIAGLIGNALVLALRTPSAVRLVAAALKSREATSSSAPIGDDGAG